MIVRQTPNALKIFFTLRGSIIPKIYPQILLITILSTLVTIIQHWLPDSFPYYGMATFTLLGIALSLPMRCVIDCVVRHLGRISSLLSQRYIMTVCAKQKTYLII